mgnify:CR=1
EIFPTMKTDIVLDNFKESVMAENLNIQSPSITIDKDRKITIFKDGVVATDINNNVLKSDYAEYDKDLKLLKSLGKT